MAIGKITSKSLAADAVTSANLAPGAVTISDIPDSEITADKLHTTLDLSTKTLTLTQASVTAHQGALSITQSQISDLSTTSDLAEGTNLYYTDARADARISAATTTDLTEGTNLYYTDARADARVALLVDSAPATLDTLNELAAALGDDPNFATTTANNIATKVASSDFNSLWDARFASDSTTTLSEGTNLYYTDARVDARITKTAIDALNVDADTLDSINSTSFLRSDTNDTFTGNQLKLENGSPSAGGLLLVSDDGTATTVSSGTAFRVTNDGGNGSYSVFESSSGVSDLVHYNNGVLEMANSSGAPILRLTAPGNEIARIELGDGSNYGHISTRPDMGDGILFYENGSNSAMLRGGKFGIGTTNPERPLHVKGANAFVRIESTSASQNSQLDIKSTTATWSIGQNQVLANTGTLEFYNGSSSPVVIKTNGNVGIGINDPAYRLDVGGIGAIQQRLKSSGDTGYTQGALVIESSDYSSNPGNRGQGVYYYNVPNLRTWYTGTLYNNGNKFGFGYKQASGFQVDAADNANAIMTLDGDNSLLEVKKTSGTLSGGANRPGATIKLHHEAQWESGYGNNQEATTNDFLGSIEFSTGDNSTGEGVRAAIRATVDSYYNSNALVFETAIDAQAVAPTEKMRIRPDGRTRIGGTDAITSQLTLGNVSDPDKITIWSDRTNGARAERTKYLSKTVRPLYNPNQYFRLNLGAGSSGTGATVRYQATFSTGHAAGHGYCEGVATFYAHHSTSRQMSTGTSGNPHISYARMYGNGSYYGWTTYPDIRFYLCNATGNDPTSGAAIYIQTSGHGHHNSGTYDLICDIQLDLQVMNSDYNADPHLTAVGSSTPSDIGAQLGCTFLS